MTKAQQVRSRRLESRQNELTVETKRIFDWILDLIDADTKSGHYGSIKVCLFYDQDELRTTRLNNEAYDMSKILLKFDRKQIFTKLKEVVEQEEGYKATVDTNATLWDSKAIVFQVVVE